MSQISEVDYIYRPVLLDRTKEGGRKAFEELVQIHSDKIVVDQFPSQKKELFKIQHPTQRLSQDDLDKLYNDWKADLDETTQGLWIYYPWSNKLIHTLEKQEFITLRTSRNQYKITVEEQNSLAGKTIGIIGLSVGSAVAMSIATERVCGRLKLADYDVIELSNLNRLKTGIQNIGLNKCIVTAREVAEIDPFIDIECFLEGITPGNIGPFLNDGSKLDILIDECDDIEIKISSRKLAKQYGIPVVMETSDRGMLDVERYDYEPDRPVFHGLLSGIPDTKLEKISAQDRIPLVMQIVDIGKSSYRARLSLLEMGQSINTWPQLASAVTLGGAVVTDVCRRMLLNQFTASGRFYVDLEQIISNPKATCPEVNPSIPTFNLDEATRIALSVPYLASAGPPTEDEITKIVEAASLAPSAGNDQPWKWLFREGQLYLFHDTTRSGSFTNFGNHASELALGAAYENAMLKSRQMGFQVKGELYPMSRESDLVAVIRFGSPDVDEDFNVYAHDLADYIYSRSTNRRPGVPIPIDDLHYAILREAAAHVPEAELHFFTDREVIDRMARVVAECELILMLNERGHSDYFERDINWTGDTHKNDGINVGTLGLTPAQLTALSMLKDEKIARALRLIGGGNLFVDATHKTISSASCLVLMTLPKDTKHKFFLGGIASQRFWLRAEQLGYSVQPLSAPLSMFARLEAGEGFDYDEMEKLKHQRSIFRGITNFDNNSDEILLIKITRADAPAERTKRLPLNEILFMINDKI
ncbi:Rv1355c family protein [Dyadobacter sp. 32]|uniref:Rv1355c family protein n=1 Tax=Dyadobacter sp. 32 TaxID=538966 RepID=UPI0011EC470B